MKKHFDEKHTNTTIKISRQCETFQSTNMDKFVVRTTPDTTKSFDIAVGKFFLAANINFAVVENSHFTELIENLHPGYKPSTRKCLGNEILDSIHSQLQSTAPVDLKGKCDDFNGWLD